jgi:TRAP transporter TAXI family solute receptor
MMRRSLALLLALALGGCSGGPDAPTLRSDVAARLAEALPGGELSLSGFDRRGSQSDAKAPAGESRRIVYFDAELKLEGDYNFGTWDGPGIAGLISALGAGPKGIEGLTPGGNKAGDRLRVHGTALYKRDGGKWVAVAAGAFRPTTAPSYATNTPQGPAAMLEAMRKVIDSVQRDASPAQVAIVEQELGAANTAIRARLARAADGYGIAAGPQHGQYLRFAQALGDGKFARSVPLVTRGGEDNLRLLRAGKVSLALAQGDAALDAYEGKGNFAADGPFPALRAVGSLYPEPVHVVVRADSGLATLADIAGRRVAIGVPGSASHGSALRVLQAHGLAADDIVILELPLNEALRKLRSKQADVVIQVIGVPADSVRDALAEVPLRLLPLSQRAVARLASAKAGYFAYSIPRGAYPSQEQDVRTVATAALLLVGVGLTETEVGAVTRFVFESGRDFAARGSAQGMQVSVANARQGVPIPLHVAAVGALDAMVMAKGAK